MLSTCDWGDRYKDDRQGSLRVLPPVFRHYGARQRFCGTVLTVRCLDDNTPVKAAVEAPGQGRVLVVDGGASLRRALLGGNLAASAAAQGWAGLVINGCVRDVGELAEAQVGICALAQIPLPTVRRHAGETGVPLDVQGVRIVTGDWLLADADGIIVLDAAPA